MSIFYLGSYLSQINYKSDVIDNLSSLLIKPKNNIGTSYIIDRKLVDCIRDTLVKFGFMILARDEIAKLTLLDRDQIFANFFLHNFIYDSKAFLDSLAVTLNEFFQISCSGGEIDLQKQEFRKQIPNDDICKIISSKQKWITDVGEWRKCLIHRFSILVASYSTISDTPDKQFENSAKSFRMPSKPVSFFDMKEYVEKGGKSQCVLPFCNEWIKHADCFMQDVFNIIVKKLMN